MINPLVGLEKVIVVYLVLKGNFYSVIAISYLQMPSLAYNLTYKIDITVSTSQNRQI